MSQPEAVSPPVQALEAPPPSSTPASASAPSGPRPADWNRAAAARLARASFASIAVWIGATTWLHARGPAWLFSVLDLPFRFVCHRLPERILSIAGTPMPLCSRCAGIWIGLSLSAAIAWPVLPMRALRVVVPAALAIMIAEVVTQDLGFHPVFHPTRFLTGLLLSVPFGGAVGGLIVRELGGARSDAPEVRARPSSPD